jgi:ribose transport system ATP-binding protein
VSFPDGESTDRASVPALCIEGLSKRFGGAVALDDVSLTVGRGEVHGLLGQNGSGKSTLIKILAGFHERDPGGRIWIDGQELLPGGSRRLAIAFVHQHLGLIPSLSVLENLLIGELAKNPRWRINWSAEAERARQLLQRYDLAIDPFAQVAHLTPVERALLAILRAFDELRIARLQSASAGLLVLDEPTPFLPGSDVARLFALMRGLVQDGASVIFVSHDIDEVMEITDRATVLRDGRVVGTFATRDTGKDEIVRLIVGRAVESAPRAAPQSRTGTSAIKMSGLRGDTVADFSLGAANGEVVGLTGLIGSGYDEVLYLVYGALPAAAGRLDIDGNAIDLTTHSPAAAIRAGCVLIPGDRMGKGAVGSLSVLDNIGLPMLGTICRPWMVRREPLARQASSLAERFDVRPRSPDLPFQSLSGGNQQKVLLAKWFQTAPRLILLDEPTQGVDVGARQQVFAAIRQAVRDGATVLCASSDHEQLAEICDRVLVFNHGWVVAELSGADLSKPAIAAACYTTASGMELAV